MPRFLGALIIALATLTPVSAAADPSPVPSPSPGLETFLAAPPSGYTALTTGFYRGRFDAHRYAATWGPDATQGEATLIADGFVDGYGMTWSQRSTGRILVEFVIAFRGGNGAVSWLGSEKVENYQDIHFQHPDSIDGVGPYYGVHSAQASPPSVLDGFEFVKGNDVLGVAFYSPKNDVLSLAVLQSHSQYKAAPEETIPKTQWPENAPSNARGTADPGGGIGQVVIIGTIVIGALFVAVVLVQSIRALTHKG